MAGTTELLLGIGLIGTKEEAPATLPADFFSSKDASVTTVEEAQAAKENSNGQAHGATLKPQKPEAFDWSKFGATPVETPQSDKPTSIPTPSKWVN